MIKLNLCAIYDFTTQNDGYKQTGARKWLTVPACWCFSFFFQISSDEQLLARRSYLTPGISSNSQQTDRIYRKRGDDKHVIQKKKRQPDNEHNFETWKTKKTSYIAREIFWTKPTGYLYPTVLYPTVSLNLYTFNPFPAKGVPHWRVKSSGVRQGKIDKCPERSFGS